MLFWCRANNFGDEIGPYVVSCLSGKNVVYREVRNRKVKDYVRLLIDILKRAIKYKPLFLDRLCLVINSKVLLTVGSILKDSGKNCTVWGSGIMLKNDCVNGGEFRAVRGILSQKRLVELGYDPPKIIGDPALLLPLIYRPKIDKKYFLGVIPHKWDYKEIAIFLKGQDGVLLIDLSDSVEQVIDKINSCERVISTSLHGIIVSHAYGIPALWFKKGYIGGDNVKFEDYFGSVCIDSYTPFEFNDTMSFSSDEVECFFEINKNISICQAEIIHNICSGLLSVAPFEIIEKYK